jgi:ribosomal protein L29
VSAAELNKKIHDLQSILAGYRDSLKEATTEHDKSQYRKYIAETETKITGLQNELRTSY